MCETFSVGSTRSRRWKIQVAVFKICQASPFLIYPEPFQWTTCAANFTREGALKPLSPFAAINCKKQKRGNSLYQSESWCTGVRFRFYARCSYCYYHEPTACLPTFVFLPPSKPPSDVAKNIIKHQHNNTFTTVWLLHWDLFTLHTSPSWRSLKTGLNQIPVTLQSSAVGGRKELT